MNQILADVALPLPLPQLFTYIVPPHLKDSVSPGSTVIVPFGKKILTGVVIKFRNDIPQIRLKQIIDLAVFDQVIEKNDITLSEWIADYYAVPLGEAIKLFLPAGSGGTSKSIVRLLITPETFHSTASAQQKIIAALKNGPVSIEQIRKRSGVKNIHSLLNDLKNDGVVSIEEVRAQRQKDKKARFFRKLPGATAVSFRGKKQTEAWEKITSSAATEFSVTEFLKTHATSLTVLKALEQRQLIGFFEKNLERKASFEMDEHISKSISIVMNEMQKEAVKQIVSGMTGGTTQTFLLHGVTGSGKTQVYIEAIRHVLAKNKTAIVLIPEISLTPQTVKRFQIHFGDKVVWMHSKMSAGERHDAWRMIHEGKYSIVIGPRSALFAPLKNIGLIIVDEEHEASYKQFDAHPRYNARDVAIVRASLNSAVVVLGSATPSIESYFNTQNGKYTLLNLPDRADNALLPPVTIVNMIEVRKQTFIDAKARAKELGKHAFQNLSRSISPALESKIRDRLTKREGVILLQNRRGFAPFIECTSCGHIEQCDRCSVTMTYHATKKHMRCHYCGTVKPAPTVCASCGGFEFSLNGFGTQRVEEELKGLFPDARILRMDMDTTSGKGSHEKILKQFGSGDADILLGTQMVAKGLDFPRVTLVGVISADTQMMLPDFRSAERTFQLLTQVAGRAGRSTLAGEVIIQTSQPKHYAMKHVVDHDFVEFYKEETEFRKSLHYPPFSRLIVIEFKGVQEKNVQDLAGLFGKKLLGLVARDSVLGPSPAVLAKIKNEFRWQIVVKAQKETDKNGTRARHAVARVYNELQLKSQQSKVRIIVDVDPAGIL